jgi:uncharacterized protein (DUF433 family)
LNSRELPAYSISEAAEIIGMPQSTLRSWVAGMSYGVIPDKKRFRNIIQLPDSSIKSLSFINLVEAHVLNAVRKKGVKMPEVRKALNYLQKKYGMHHPLAHQDFKTDGISLFVNKYGSLINISESGQLAMEELLKNYLTRIEHSEDGLAKVFYPYTRNDVINSPKIICINPELAFGRPVITGTRIPTAVIAERYKAGDSIAELAEDYGCDRLKVEEAVRSELALAA